MVSGDDFPLDQSIDVSIFRCQRFDTYCYHSQEDSRHIQLIFAAHVRWSFSHEVLKMLKTPPASLVGGLVAIVYFPIYWE